MWNKIFNIVLFVWAILSIAFCFLFVYQNKFDNAILLLVTMLFLYVNYEFKKLKNKDNKK